MDNPPHPGSGDPAYSRGLGWVAGLGGWEAGLGLVDWVGARPEEASGPRPSQTWLCARSGPGGERGAGEGEREGLEVLGRWPGSEAPGWPEVGLRVRGRPPPTITGPHAGHGRPGLSFPPSWIAGPTESWAGRGEGGNSSRPGGVSRLPRPRLAARTDGGVGSGVEMAPDHPVGRAPGLRGRGGESGPGGLGRRRPREGVARGDVAGPLPARWGNRGGSRALSLRLWPRSSR